MLGLALAIEVAVRSNRGFSLIEILVALGFIAVVTAIGLPIMNEAVVRNGVWTATEQIGSEIRQARLRAISHNNAFRVRFNCPSTNQFRVLVVTGVASQDNASDRCSQTYTYDSATFQMPANVSFGTVPTLEVNGRGIFTVSSGTIPVTINVSWGSTVARSFTVSVTGQISYEVF